MKRRHNYLLDFVLLFILAAFIIKVGLRMKTELGYTWHWSVIPRYLFTFNNGVLRPNLLMQGFFTTIRLSIWVTFFSLLTGTLAGVLSSRRSLFFRMIVRTYVEFVRNTPPLVLIFIFYYFLGNQVMDIIGVGRWMDSASPFTKHVVSLVFSQPGRLSEFFSALLTLSLYEGAYITEIVRGGINAIPKGQFEASHAVALSEFDTYRFVILPQVFKNILPSLTGQAISVIKDSSIVSIISIQELTFQGMEIMASTYLVFEVWITITALYFILTFTLSHLAHRYEKRGS